MSWNHRVLAHEHNGEIYLQIHEVYYTDGKPDSYTKNAIGVSGESLEDINWTLDKIKECLNKSVLWAGENFQKNTR